MTDLFIEKYKKEIGRYEDQLNEIKQSGGAILVSQVGDLILVKSGDNNSHLFEVSCAQDCPKCSGIYFEVKTVVSGIGVVDVTQRCLLINKDSFVAEEVLSNQSKTVCRGCGSAFLDISEIRNRSISALDEFCELLNDLGYIAIQQSVEKQAA